MAKITCRLNKKCRSLPTDVTLAFGLSVELNYSDLRHVYFADESKEVAFKFT